MRYVFWSHDEMDEQINFITLQLLPVSVIKVWRNIKSNWILVAYFLYFFGDFQITPTLSNTKKASSSSSFSISFFIILNIKLKVVFVAPVEIVRRSLVECTRVYNCRENHQKGNGKTTFMCARKFTHTWLRQSKAKQQKKKIYK